MPLPSSLREHRDERFSADCTGDGIGNLPLALHLGPQEDAIGTKTHEFDETILLDSDTAAVLGEWYLLGQRALEEAVSSIPSAAASVGRLWPEHFDFGIDLAAKPDVRVNLGAAAGDGGIDEPYLYVGPWGPERPGAAEYWTAPFGATLTFRELNLVESPLGRAVEFFLHGLSSLRQ